MVDGQFLASLMQLLGSTRLLGLILLAVPIGMLFGAVPGLGGKLAIAMMIPFVFGMQMIEGAVFLVALHAVVHTGGSLPSILLGVPGTGPDAATVVDGYPMARRGEAGRALGASLAASGVGGVIGALALALLLPLLEPLMLAFGSAEIFMLAVFGITFVAALSGDRLRQGLIVGLLGLACASVGMDPVSGVTRFTFGQLAFWEGLDLVTAVLALFAIPEMLDLALGASAREPVPAKPARFRFREVLAGMGDVLTHRWLALRTSVIGTLIGLIPGLGGDVSAWICYGHAVQSSKTPERFGQGAVEGVIAPETANNAKEGGALVPTLFFGVPGSSGMVLLLGAFVMLGITPGPELMLNQQGLLWTLVWALVLANLVAVLLFLPLAAPLGRVTQLRAPLVVPVVLVLALLGSHLSSGHWQQLPVLALLGGLGYILKRQGWPRSPFVVGLILGPIAEVSLHRAWSIWGVEMLLRPLVLLLAALTAASLALYVLAAPPMSVRIGLALLMVMLFAAVAFTGYGLAETGSALPLLIGSVGLGLSAWQLLADVRHRATEQAVALSSGDRRHLAWFVLLLLVVLLSGFVPGAPVWILLYLRWGRGEGWALSLGLSGAMLVLLWGGFEVLSGLSLFEGLLRI